MENNKTNLIKEVDIKDVSIEISETLSQIKVIDKEVDNLFSKAHEALDKAKQAKGKNANWSITGKNKQEAIEALQEATIANANAISSSYDSTLELLKNQKSMSNSISHLFGLGVSNLEANRIAIKQLEDYFKEAASGELEKYARKELENIIRQLRAQRDIWLCIDKFEKSKKVLDELKHAVYKLEQLCTKDIETRFNEMGLLLNKLVHTIKKYSEKIDKVSQENTQLIQEKFEKLYASIEQKLQELKSNIQKQIQTQEEKIEEYRKEAKDKLPSELQELQGKCVASEEFETLLKRYQNLENKVYKKYFFDSIWYKGTIGIIS